MNKLFKNSKSGRTLKDFLRFLLALSCIILFNNQLFSATYYIDPTSTASGTPDGTMAHPFLSWNDVSWVAGSSYFQKRGTECEVSEVIRPTVSNITLGAYGTGERPIIKSTVGDRAKGIEFNGAGFTIKDLEIYSTNEIVCAILLYGEGPFVINNCVLHHCAWGIRAFNLTGKLTISNTEIYSTGDDGVYTEDTEDIEIFGCYVHEVNSDLPVRETAGGDCIQITGAQGYLNIHDNILDHSAFGRKFCLIIGSALDGRDEPSAALVERNVMIGFQGDVDVTSGLYLKESISNLIFRYNTVKDAATGLWMNTPTTAHNNLFIRCWQGITVNAGITGNIYNNTFVNNTIGIESNYGSTTYVYNNIFQSGSMTKEHIALNGNVNSDYNCFDKDAAGIYGNDVSTLAVVKSERKRDLHSFVANPLFVNLALENFHLTENSPCVDKGKVISDVTRDKDGVAIAKGIGPDMGAYEFVIGGSVPEDPDTLIGNTRPIVKVKYDEQVFAGIVKTIDASESYDPDNDALTFKWIAPKGLSFSSTSSPTVQILADDQNLPAIYSVQLQVTDGKVSESRDITVRVAPYQPDLDEIRIVAIEASNFQNPNYPENIIDGDSTTRWAAEGTDQWLCFEMEKTTKVNFVKVQFFNGENRKSYFDIYASLDKVTWEPLMEEIESSGFSSKNHVFPLTEQKAAEEFKYVKLVGNCNSENNWNSYTEFHVYGGEANPSSLTDELKQDFLLYPNPASEMVTIQLDETAVNLKVQVIDYSGKILIDNTLSNVSDAQIVTETLQPGIYFVRLSSDKEIFMTQKLVIQ